MGKFCTNCGEALKDGAGFCIKCGTRVASADVAAQPAETTPAAPVETPFVVTAPEVPVEVSAAPSAVVAAPKKKRKKAPWVILAIIAVVLAIGMALFFARDAIFGDYDDVSKSKRKEDSANTKDDDARDDDDNRDDEENQSDEEEDYRDDQEDDRDDEDDDDEKKSSGNVEKTVMIYVVGSDLESVYNAASADIDEMLDSGVDTDKNNILLYTGGASDWDNEEISADENAIWRIEDDELTQLETFDSENMGESETLSEFISYGIENYPSDQYVLILWDHGGGPFVGFGVDELHYNDMLEMDEIQEALEDGLDGEKFELIGFDACLMGSIETAWYLKDHANYFVASQELEPGFGWNYEFLEDLETYEDGEELGTAIVDAYFEAAEGYSSYRQMDMTLSCLDLSEMDDVEDSLNALFSEVDDDISDDAFADVSRCRNKTKTFASGQGYDLVDLTHLASLLEDDYPDEAETLLEDLEDLICYSKANVKHAEGVSVYHPYDNIDYMDWFIERSEDSGFATKYVDYITNFGEILADGGSKNMPSFSKNTATAQQVGNNNELKMQLTEEQAAVYSSSQYVIFRKMSADETFSKEDEYLPVFVGQDATLDNNNLLSATYEGKALFGIDSTTGEVSSAPLSLWQYYDGSGELKYYFSCIFSSFSDEFIMDVVDWYMIIEDGKPYLRQAVMADDGDGEEDSLIADKNYVNPDDYEIYQFLNSAFFVDYDENGNVVLETTGSIYGYEYMKENGFTIEIRDLEDKSDYYVMFTITDIYGNKTHSALFELE